MHTALTHMNSIFHQVSWHESFIILSPAIYWIGWVKLVGQANFCGTMQESWKNMGHRDIFCACFVCVCLFVRWLCLLYTYHRRCYEFIMHYAQISESSRGLKPWATNRKRVISPLNHLGSSLMNCGIWNLFNTCFSGAYCTHPHELHIPSGILACIIHYSIPGHPLDRLGWVSWPG